MNPPRPLLPTVMRIALDLAWFGGWMLALFLIVGWFVVPSKFASISLRLPASFDAGSFALSVSGAEGARLERGVLAISLAGLDQALQVRLMLPAAVLMAAWLAGVSLVRRIVRTLRDGQPFCRENARHLHRLGVLIIAAELFNHAFRVWVGAEFLERIQVEGLTLSTPTFDPSWTVIFLGLGFVVLAGVFREGVALREDVELTV